MAGITGIIRKNKQITPEFLTSVVAKAATKLSIHSELPELHQFAARGDVAVHISVTTGDLPERKFVYENDPDGMLVAMDGEIFINEDEKKNIQKQNLPFKPEHEIQYLPLLYRIYGDDFQKKIYGQYNILFYDPANSYIVLFNDRLGYMPLYIFDSEQYVMFASKIESILQAGILKTIQFDPVSISEHFLFHYTLSDHTYIRGIQTLPHATIYTFQNGFFKKSKYWEPGEFFGIPSTGRKESIDCIDAALKQSISQIVKRSNSPLHFSLTGGWDSRVILSYLLSQNRDRFHSYSFGAPGWDDIEIPRQIADGENFSYDSYQLDSSYLTNHFLNEASDTIQFSNGTRNYKRAHYLFAIRRLPATSSNMLSGIFGDEVFKVGMPQGGTVIASSVVKLLKCNFEKDAVRKFVQNSEIKKYLQLEKTDMEELVDRISEVGSWLSMFDNSGERYFAFRFCLNLRKYFGAEINSYNDFVNCYSPFIDYHFLKSFSKTSYMVSNYEFKKPGLKEKYRSSRLYYELVRRNYEPLSDYRTSRGFSMKETGTLLGMTNILLKKYVKKRLESVPDAFNTEGTDKLFKSSLLNHSVPSILNDHANRDEQGVSTNNIIQTEDFYSMYYWLQHITKTYMC